ncbi:MAG: ABC transporter permease [Prolixibacteraceae bacterium]|nr:ABC transporter permease [Prolixibacteraceae bacterium]
MFRISKTFRNRLERIYLFANTDYYARYYGSKLGILWAFLKPFFHIMVLYVTFSYLIFRQRDPHFILYLFTGIITWQYFSEMTNTSINLFSKQRNILQNSDMPKIDLFWALLGSKFWGYLINFMIFIVFYVVFFNPVFSLKYFFLIPVWLGLSMFSLGFAFYLATFFIYLRDLDHLWSIVLMAGFWMVPIIWNYKILEDTYQFMNYIPITAFLIDIRQIVLHDELPNMHYLVTALIVSFLIAFTGYIFMQRKSKKALEFL